MAVITEKSSRPCRIFMCYRGNTAAVANVFRQTMEDDHLYQYGNIWYSDLEGYGNFIRDIPALIHEAEWVIFFVGKTFTGGFLDSDKETNIDNTTAKELVAIETERQRREAEGKMLKMLSINIDGAEIDEACAKDLRHLFRNAGILKDDSVDTYRGLNHIPFNSRSDKYRPFIMDRIAPLCAVTELSPHDTHGQQMWKELMNNRQTSSRKTSKEQGLGYTVDMVFCIDGTSSMEEHGSGQKRLINNVKENAKHLYTDYMHRMNQLKKNISSLRIRIILFRDYLADGDSAMVMTQFYDLPQQSELFEKAVYSISAMGGGDIPEDGLEALAYAIKSSWKTNGKLHRRIIVVWSDAETHPLGFGSKAPNYPKGMASDFDELTEWWKELPMNSKRLILFTPDEPAWSNISTSWENVIHFPSAAGDGLAEHGYGEILDVIAHSI